MTLQLRDYQVEAVRAIDAAAQRSVLAVMATGLGKTVIFSRLLRRGRMLILSHREELVRQPIKYFDCPVGIEQAGQSANGEEVVSASVQSIVRRLDRFKPEEFDQIVVDECHHASALTYKAILAHFTPRKIIGFTATPNRADGAGLSDIFEKIVVVRDIRWGIENEWLANLTCKRVNIGFDLCNVRSKGGDFDQGALAQACDIPDCVKAVAQAAREIASPPCLIFAVSVENAHNIAAEIPGAVALDGTSKNREDVVAAFQAGNIPYLVNCALFTEGFDAPETRSVVIARPTQSLGLYCQMVGRVLRRTKTKDRALLVDCVGASRLPMHTAPSLLGIDIDAVEPAKRDEIEGDLFAELGVKASMLADTPESWIRNVKIVDLWAKANKLDLRDVLWFRCADGSLKLPLPDWKWLRITAPNLRGECRLETYKGYESEPIPQQKALDLSYELLCRKAQDSKTLWSAKAAKRWGRDGATDKQMQFIARKVGREMKGLTRLEASRVICRFM